MWAAGDDAAAPQAFLVGSANLTIAGLHDNVEVMALADTSDHAYLRSTLQELLDKSWDATERLAERIEHGDTPPDRHHPRSRQSRRTPASDRHTPAASSGCGPQVLAAAALVATGVAYLMERRRSRS